MFLVWLEKLVERGGVGFGVLSKMADFIRRNILSWQVKCFLRLPFNPSTVSQHTLQIATVVSMQLKLYCWQWRGAKNLITTILIGKVNLLLTLIYINILDAISWYQGIWNSFVRLSYHVIIWFMIHPRYICLRIVNLLRINQQQLRFFWSENQTSKDCCRARTTNQSHSSLSLDVSEDDDGISLCASLVSLPPHS